MKLVYVLLTAFFVAVSPNYKQALRLVLPDTEEMVDEDLGVLFMKIDANGSGGVDWDEFTGFLLQARNEKHTHTQTHAAGDF